MSLASLIERYPEQMLGVEAFLRYGPTLPFLFKILSAARPLSLQVHPDRESALSGFARETKAGIPHDAPERCYRDRNGKAELVMALTPFTCLCGFREVSESISLMSPINCAPLTRALERLRATRDYRVFLSVLLSLTDTDGRSVVSEARRVAESRSLEGDPYERVSYLCGHYPDDVGILAPLYLNSFTLAPGEALFLKPRVPHTYLSGTALELMSNSDNVIRGGLTAKTVNQSEFLDILDPTPFLPEILQVPAKTGRLERYLTSFPDFELSLFEATATPVDIPTGTPSILLVTEGTLELTCQTDSGWRSGAGKGSVYFVPASAPRTSLAGSGTAYLASLPRCGKGEP